MRLLLALYFGILNANKVDEKPVFCLLWDDYESAYPIITTGWHCLGDTCYKFVTQKAHWSDSRLFCQQKYGGDLASIHSDLDNEYILKDLVGDRCHIWLGGVRDFSKPKSFSWVDKSEWNYDNWEPGEPNDFFSNEDCLEGNHFGLTGGWNDKECTHAATSICQVKMGPRVLVLGGFNPIDKLLDKIELFIPHKPFLNSMQSETLLVKTAESAVGVVNDLVFVAGGVTENIVATNLLQIYNITSKKIFYRPPMTEIRRNAAGAIVGSKFCVCGGTTAKGWPVHRSCECYNTESNNWSSIGNMTVPRTEFAMVSLNNVIYAVGGWPLDAQKSAERFDWSTAVWTKIEPMNKGAFAFGLATLGNALVACGGYNNSHSLSRCEKYTPETNKWHDIRSMGVGRAYFSMVNVNGQLVALGGWNDANGFLNSVEFMDSQTWKMSPAPLLFSRYRFSAVTVG